MMVEKPSGASFALKLIIELIFRLQSPTEMDPELVAQTLNFHGQQLTKLWESERGALQSSVSKSLDYQSFQQRSKDLA